MKIKTNIISFQQQKNNQLITVSEQYEHLKKKHYCRKRQIKKETSRRKIEV